MKCINRSDVIAIIAFEGVHGMVEAVFTEEDRKNLSTLAEELPKLRLLLEELIETIEVMGDNELMKSIRTSEVDVQEGRLVGFNEILKELGLDDREI